MPDQEAEVTRLRRTTQRLRRSEHQQAAVAGLGQAAIAGASVQSLFDDAVRLLSERLGVSHAEVLEYRQDTNDFLLVAASGFRNARPGEATVGAGLLSQAGFTLRERGPVVCENLAAEKRFTAPQLLLDEGIVSGVSVLVGSVEDPWGVIGVHNVETFAFSADDVNFGRSVSFLLSAAINQRALHDQTSELADRLETVLDAAKVGTWVWDPESDLSTWDDRMWELTGLACAPRPSGRMFMDLVHPDDRERVERAVRETAEKGVPFQDEFRLIRGDGEVRWQAAVGRVRTDDRGGKRLFGVNFDVTERVQSSRKLIDSESRCELALEAAAFGTWEMQPDSGEMLWDSRMCELFGLPQRESVSQADLRDLVAEKDWQQVGDMLDRVKGSSASVSCEFRLSTKKRHRWLCMTGRLFPHDREPRVIGVASDITERKASEERDHLLMAELDHRVKNILANVNAIARRTAHHRPDPEDFTEALEGRLMAMAEAHSLLSMSQWSGVDLGVLLRTEVSPYLTEREADLTIEGGEFELSPKAAQIICLFLHELTTNAAKHGALHHQDGRLAISWKLVDDRLVFDWIETVPGGVSPPSRRGFGLTVIEEMTAMDLSAEIELDFREEGLACRLSMPRAARSGATEAQIARPVALQVQAPAPSGSNSAPWMNVLVVEDSASLALTLKQILEKAGHAVIGPAARLEQALELVDSHEIDVAILDIRLDDKLVFPLADRLAEAGIPFGFATGYALSRLVPERFADRPVVAKPYAEKAVGELVLRLAVA